MTFCFAGLKRRKRFSLLSRRIEILRRQPLREARGTGCMDKQASFKDRLRQLTLCLRRTFYQAGQTIKAAN
jgi:hypothetical protein